MPKRWLPCIWPWQLLCRCCCIHALLPCTLVWARQRKIGGLQFHQERLVLSKCLKKVSKGLIQKFAFLACCRRTLLKYILPLGFLFALALYCSNRAYLYSSVAFLQFCKEGNVALIFAMSCLLGLQAWHTQVWMLTSYGCARPKQSPSSPYQVPFGQVFSWHKVAILSIVVAGCSLCAHGHLVFRFLMSTTSDIWGSSQRTLHFPPKSGAKEIERVP